MNPGRSLRFRLLTAAVVSIALALTVAGVVIADLFAVHARSVFEGELIDHLSELTAHLERDGAALTLVQPPSDPRFRRPQSGHYWQIVENGAVQLTSPSLWDENLPPPPAVPQPGQVERYRAGGPAGQSLTLVARRVLLDGEAAPVTVTVAGDEAALDAAAAGFNRTLGLSLLLLGLVLSAAAAAQVAVGLWPLARLRRELVELRDGRRRRFTAAAPAEVAPLIDDLNTLLDHAEDVVARARLQAGNLAHAQKTDLAVIANDLDGLRGRGADAALDQAAARIALMRRHVAHHLARARAAAARGVPGMSVPLEPAVAALRRTMEKLHARRALEVSTAIAPGLAFAGEAADFDEILGNLFDNACLWARGRVAVSAHGDGPMLVLMVEDDGPGLAPAVREAVLNPGVRLDESKPGSGLGLSIARDLARLYGGGVDLDESPLGGLAATVRLPRAKNLP